MRKTAVAYQRIYPPIRSGRTSIIRQKRLDTDPVFHCVSWRESLDESGKNRRFYNSADSCWSIPAGTALTMLREAAAAKFFDESEAVSGKIRGVKIAAPGTPDHHHLLGQVLLNCIHDHAWRNGSAIICTQTDGAWRKVMLLDQHKQQATFRSLTTDSSYRLASKELTDDGWHLDRAMVDAHPVAFLHWLEHLEKWLKI
jgi:hypothetical protein